MSQQRVSAQTAHTSTNGIQKIHVVDDSTLRALLEELFMDCNSLVERSSPILSTSNVLETSSSAKVNAENLPFHPSLSSMQAVVVQASVPIAGRHILKRLILPRHRASFLHRGVVAATCLDRHYVSRSDAPRSMPVSDISTRLLCVGVLPPSQRQPYLRPLCGTRR